MNSIKSLCRSIRFEKQLWHPVVLIIVVFLLMGLNAASCQKDNQGFVKDVDSTRSRNDNSNTYEDFSGPLDPNKWGVMSLPYSAGNKESQWYRPQNLVISEGTLKIIAKKETFTGLKQQAPEMSFISNDKIMRAAPQEVLPAGTRYWTSGLINTREAASPKYFPLFSRFEIRARVPHGQGLLPAFWLRRKGGAGWGEVDIMEYFGNYRPGYSKFSLHFPKTLGVNTSQQFTYFEKPVKGTGGWHTWSVEIRPSKEHSDELKDPIEFVAYLDGVQYGYYKLTDEQTIRDLHMIDRNTGKKIYTDKPEETWDMCVNMAVGGQWVGQPDQQLGYLPIPNRCSKDQKVPLNDDGLACNVDGLFFAQFPATFEIDYINIYKLK